MTSYRGYDIDCIGQNYCIYRRGDLVDVCSSLRIAYQVIENLTDPDNIDLDSFMDFDDKEDV